MRAVAGKCANRKCLEDMNAAYLVEKAMQMLADHPTASLAYSIFYTYNDTTVKRLEELGYEVDRLSCRHEDYPNCPSTRSGRLRDHGRIRRTQRDFEQEQEVTRLNARTYYDEVKRGKYRSMFLSVTKTSFSVMWRTPQRIRQTARYRQRRKNLLRLRNWKSRTSAIRKSPLKRRLRTPRSGY